MTSPDFAALFPILGEGAVVTYLAIHQHAEARVETPLSTTVLCELTGFGAMRVALALSQLTDHKLIAIDERAITIDGVVVPWERHADPDDTIRQLTEEVARLRRRVKLLENGDTCGLADTLKNPAEAEVIRLAEDVCGRGLTVQDVLYLGNLMGYFPPETITKMLKQKSQASDPLKRAYFTLNGVRAKHRAKKPAPELEQVKYWTPSDDYKPYG